MCGISGSITRSPIDQSRIDKALGVMKHRGPDDSGYVARELSNGWHLTLLHTRLSIIDLDKRSSQPMVNKRGDLIFNGEIYNYKEIRNNFKNKSKWHTNGDTEVLSAIIDNKGINGLQECEGMWAFAWFDRLKETLTLCRDRFGEKPLYIFKLDNGGLIFGSEPKSIFALLGRRPAINQSHIRRFIVNGYKSLYKTKDTFFHGLEELAPGHVCLWNPEKGFKEWPWWSPSFNNIENDMSFKEAVTGTREKLNRSIELRLRADVPIAFCLSGGVDSNALISIAKHEFGRNVHSFTVMNEDKRYEEAEMVEIAVKKLGVKHTAIPVSKIGFLENLKRLISYHDAPVYTLSSYAQWQLMKAVSSSGYKVSVSGNGADELFSGYYDHHNAYLEYIWNNRKDEYYYCLDNWNKSAGKYVRNPFLINPEYFIETPMCRDHIFLDADLMAKYLREPFYEPFTEKLVSNILLRNRMANELTNEVVPVLLHEEDLNAMSYSIENRSPYLDNSLFEWSTKIPTKFLINNGLAKAVLRKSVEDIAPIEVINNKRKVGFNIPIDSYIDFDCHETKEYFLEDNSEIMEIINKDALKLALEAKGNRSNEESKFLFNFISSKIFVEEYS